MINGPVIFGDEVGILIHWVSGGNGGSLISRDVSHQGQS